MNNFEKILFIDLTCHQFGIPNTDHPDFISTWRALSENEKNEFVALTNKVHEIWSYINMPLIIDLNTRVNSVFEYNDIITLVDERILTVCRDFGVTLKEELTEEFKATAKRILGDDYFTWYET